MPGRGWWFQSVGSLTMYKSGTRFIVSANTPWIHSDMYLWINKIVTILMINISTNYLLEMRVGRKTFLLPSQVWFLGNCELNWQKSYISSLMLIFLRDWKLHRKEVKNQRSIWTWGPLGFPWHSGKESSWECSRHKRCGFDPLLGKIPGVGNGNPLQYSCQDNSWAEEPGRLQSMWSQRVGHDWAIEHVHPQHKKLWQDRKRGLALLGKWIVGRWLENVRKAW